MRVFWSLVALTELLTSLTWELMAVSDSPNLLSHSRGTKESDAFSGARDQDVS